MCRLPKWNRTLHLSNLIITVMLFIVESCNLIHRFVVCLFSLRLNDPYRYQMAKWDSKWKGIDLCKPFNNEHSINNITRVWAGVMDLAVNCRDVHIFVYFVPFLFSLYGMPEKRWAQCYLNIYYVDKWYQLCLDKRSLIQLYFCFHRLPFLNLKWTNSVYFSIDTMLLNN